MLKFGRVQAIDNATQRVRVQFASDENMVSYWLAMISRKTLKDQIYCMPDTGELVACLMDANCEEGVVLGAIYSQADPTPIADDDKDYHRYSDGTWFEYDRANHVLTGDIQGAVNISVLKDVDLTVQGALTAQAEGNVTATSGQTLFLRAAQAIVIETPEILCGGYEGGELVGTITANLNMIGDLAIQGNNSVTGNVSAGATVSAGSDVTAGQDMTAGRNIIAAGTISDGAGEVANVGG